VGAGEEMEVKLSMVHFVLLCVASVFIDAQTVLLIEHLEAEAGWWGNVFGIFTALCIIMATILHGRYRQRQSMA